MWMPCCCCCNRRRRKKKSKPLKKEDVEKMQKEKNLHRTNAYYFQDMNLDYNDGFDYEELL